MLYAFFWVIPQCQNFICRRLGTLCSIFIGKQAGRYLPAHEDGTECPGTSEYKILIPGNYPEESIWQKKTLFFKNPCSGSYRKKRGNEETLPIRNKRHLCGRILIIIWSKHEFLKVHDIRYKKNTPLIQASSIPVIYLIFSLTENNISYF